MRAMPGRPCRPSADMKELWRLLLPGMNVPACGVEQQSDAPVQVEPLNETTPQPETFAAAPNKPQRSDS